MIKKRLGSLKNKDFLYRIKLHFFRNKQWFRMFSILYQHTKIVDNKIVFCNMQGLGFGGDPKYIVEYINEKNLDFQMTWLIDKKLVKSKKEFPSNVKIVSLYSVAALKELSSAHFWVDNARKFIYTKKKDKQIYIQTWHGTFPTKFIEKDAENCLSDFYIRIAKNDSDMIDYILSGCKRKTEIYKNSFYYSGKILEIGTPKEDLFFDLNKVLLLKNKVKKYYKINDKFNIVMYAPTFRQNLNMNVYDLNYSSVIKECSKKFKSDYIMFVRFHPNLVYVARNLELPPNVINVTDYPDMQELICASDIIITDYSSSLDYSIFNRKIMLYCPDYKQYMENERDFYIKIKDLPFMMAQTNEELIKNIKEFDEKKYNEELKKAYEKYGLLENGESCKKTIELFQYNC